MMIVAGRFIVLFLLVQLTQGLWVSPNCAKRGYVRTAGTTVTSSYCRVSKTSRVASVFHMVKDDDSETKNQVESEDFVEEEEDKDEEEVETVGDMDEQEEAEEIKHDPHAEAIKALEKELNGELSSLEAVLKAERLSLSRARDKVSESGKTGFYIVQAQVADFQKRRDADQKARVERNKKEFIEKMIPVVDAFREAPLTSPATTEKEENMHKNFGSLLQGILTVFGKYGFEEFNAEVGSKVDPVRHSAVEVVEGEEDGIVLEGLQSGFVDKKDGSVIRRASVVVSKVPRPVDAEVVTDSVSVSQSESEESSDNDDAESNGDDDEEPFPEGETCV